MCVCVFWGGGGFGFNSSRPFVQGERSGRDLEGLRARQRPLCAAVVGF